MKKTIVLSGGTVTYELTWKTVKNLNLRIRSDGTVAVSAPRRAGSDGVEAFLRKNEEFLFRALEKAIAANEKKKWEEKDLVDGGVFPLLGIRYPVKVTAGTKNFATVKNGMLLVSVTDVTSEEKICKAVCDLLERMAKEWIPLLCEELRERFASDRIPLPRFRFRRMVSRWGSCCPAKETVTINKFLLCAPIECIEYVVAHELAHFLFLDHSKAFYAALSCVMPDWKQRKKVLESYGGLIRRIGKK